MGTTEAELAGKYSVFCRAGMLRLKKGAGLCRPGIKNLFNGATRLLFLLVQSVAAAVSGEFSYH